MSGMLKTVRGKIVAGLVTIAPLAATILILKWVFGFFAGFTTPFLDKILPSNMPGLVFITPTLGFIITVLLIFFLGILVTNILGKRLVHWGEWILRKIPVANTIYGTAKQITQALIGASSRAFQKTVLISYPHEGIWTLAFVTGESEDKNGKEYYHVFVSTTPNPTSGFMLIVPKEDTFDANLTVEEGLKAIISGGMLAPSKNQIMSKGK